MAEKGSGTCWNLPYVGDDDLAPKNVNNLNPKRKDPKTAEQTSAFSSTVDLIATIKRSKCVGSKYWAW